MLNIPSVLREQFKVHLRDKPVPISAHGPYMKWLRYYLEFCVSGLIPKDLFSYLEGVAVGGVTFKRK